MQGPHRETVRAADPVDPTDPGEPSRRWTSTVLGGVVAAVVLAVVALTVYPLVRARSGPPTPAASSVEVGFTRDMRAHLRQGVGLSTLALDRAGNQAVRRLAQEVALAEQEQAGQLHGWLVLWRAAPQDPGGTLAWMRDDVHSHPHAGPQASGTTSSAPGQRPPALPGAPSAVELDVLRRSAPGVADVHYLRLLVRHLHGGLELARAVQRRTDDPAVRALAREVVDHHTARVREALGLLMRLDG